MVQTIHTRPKQCMNAALVNFRANDVMGDNIEGGPGGPRPQLKTV